jgi:hypothetical protein
MMILSRKSPQYTPKNWERYQKQGGRGFGKYRRELAKERADKQVPEREATRHPKETLTK